MKKSFYPFVAGCLCVILISLQTSYAQTSWKGTTSTNWSTAGNWTAGVPTSTVDAIIGDASFTGVNQPTISATANCKSLTIGGTKTSVLTVNRTTTVAANLLINGNGTITHPSYSLTVKGNWINNGTYNATGTGSNVIFAGVTQALQGSVVTTFRKLTINAGSVTTLNTNVTVSGSSSRCTVKGTLDPNESPTYKLTGTTFNVNTNAVIKVKGAVFTDNYSNSGTVTLSSNSIVNYAATSINQTISNAYTYSTLTISGAGIKSLTASLPALRSSSSSNGNIIVSSGTLDLGAFTANRGTSSTGGSLTVANGAFLKIDGTNTLPANYSTVTFNLTSTVEYNGGNQAVSARTYGNLILSGSSGVVTKTMPGTAFLVAGDFSSNVGTSTSVSYTAASAITVSGSVTIGAATTFNGGSYAHIVSGNWTNNGSFTGATSTINMTGGGSMISGAGTHNFYNLNISGSNITATSNISVAGDLTTTSPGTFTHQSGSTLSMTGTTKNITGIGITLENVTISGSISSSSSIVVTGNISVAGSFTNSSPGNILMNGTTKTIGGGGTILFSSLQVTGSVIASSGFSISKSLDVSGTFSATAGIATFTSTSTLNGTANLFNVTINGTSLALSASSVLGISSALTVTAGTLDVTSNKPNTVIFNGTGAQSINPITYHNLTLSNGNTKTASAAITVNGNLTINTSTTFSAGSYTHTLLENWINNGTFTAGTSTIQLSGTQNTSISGATTFNILTINKTSSTNLVTLLNNVSVSVINMTTGSVSTGINTLTITSTRNGNGIILGTITRTHAFSILTDYAFEGPNNTINFTAVLGVTSITVNVTTGSISDFPNGSSINRVYNITVPAGTYVAKLRLHYEDAELNGNDENTMQLMRYNGTSWNISGKTGNSTVTNYVEQSLLTNITNRWTCSSAAGVISWNGSVSSDWNTAANWTVVSGTPVAPPSANDIVQIGSSVFTNQPTISSAVAVKSIVFGSAKAATLTLGAGGSITTSGNISGSWSGNATHTINAANQTIAVGGDLMLSNGTNGHAINLSAGAANITINGSLIQTGNAAINFTGSTSVSINGDFNYVNGAFSAGAGTLTYNGTSSQVVAGVTYNNLSINKTSGIAVINTALTTNGNLTVTAGELDIDASSTISGNVVINPGTILYGDASTINVGGNWANSGTFTAGTGTVVLNGGGAQTISSTTFNNLTIDKTGGSASLSGNITINSNLSLLAGTFDLATYTANRSSAGGQLNISNGATLLAAGSNNFPQNFANSVLGNSSTVHYNGTIAQTVTGTAYGNLVFSNGGANAKTLSSSVTVNGDITLNSGAHFNAVSYTINLWGNWTNSGTFVPATSTLVCNGVNKTINGNTTFNRVTVYGSYSNINSDITYNGLVFITSTGSYSSGGGTATVNGDLTNMGSLTSNGITNFTGTTLQTLRLLNAISSVSTGVVNFNGNVAPVLNSTSTPTFATVNINNTAGVTANRDWLVMVSMTIGAGATFNGGISSHTIRGNFTNNGTVTSDGTLNFNPPSAATLKLAGTSFSSTGTVILGGTGTVTVTGAPTALNDVRITNTNAAGITPPSGWNINGDFVINSNSIFHAGSYSYTVAGDIESNGILNGETSTFTMSSATGQLTGSPDTEFNHLTITGIISTNSDFYVGGNFNNNGTYDGTFGALIMNGSNAAVIGGTTVPSTISQLTIAKTGGATVTLSASISEVFSLFITSGTLFTSTNSITQDPGGGILMISDGATLKLGGSNSLPGFSAYGLEVYSTVEYAGTNQIVGNAASYGNLTISTPGTKTGLVPLIIQNNFTLSAGTFSSGTSVTHSIAGNWIMTGGNFINSSNTILFNGTGNQDISSTGTFNNVTINKLSGQVTLSSNVTVNAILNLTSGKISIGNSNLTMSNAGTITNANISNYVIAIGNGTLNQQVVAGGSKLFPVGLTTAYTPATITLTAGSTTDIINIRMLAAPYHGGLSGNQATNAAVNATWMIGEAVTGGSNAGITLQWPLSLELPGFNRSLSRLAHFTNSSWEFGPSDIVASGTNPYSVTRTGFTDFSPFAVSTYMALPVTWVSINGRNDDKNNIVNWTVASEEDNEYYIIEASTTGNDFIEIGRIKGAGTINIEQRYSFTHYNITGNIYYYRIKQVDFDGHYSYSKIVRVISDKATKNSVTILNNPVRDNLAVSIMATRSFTGSFNILDVSGKVVYKKKLNLNTGNNIVEIGKFGYASGVYYLVFIDENGYKTVVKFIKS